MAELNDSNEIKIIAFYLPQFHSIPENDKAYGEGFTEWSNTRKAKPIFEGEYQPRIPYKNNYYNLLDEGTMSAQAELAKKYHIYGFCYYHYWFKNGKKLLEKPIENMLNDKTIDIPFCLCWANENWTKKWDGGNNEIIAAQDYGNINDWDKHLRYLLPFFKDNRYITVDGMPLFILYRPELIPNVKKMVSYIRKSMIEFGFKGVKIAVQYPTYYLEGENRKVFDYYIAFEPAFTRDFIEISNKNPLKRQLKSILYRLNGKVLIDFINNIKKDREIFVESQLRIRDYDEDWKNIIDRVIDCPKLIPGAFTDWDNTPRNKCGIAYRGSTPEKFEFYLRKLIKKTKKDYKKNMIFINAWNEWAEGAYLEADQKYEYAYLEAVKRSCEEEY